MDGNRLQGINHPGKFAFGKQRQSDFRIGRAGDRPELIGRDDMDVVPHLAQFVAHGFKGAHYSIYLGVPGIGYDQYSHAVFPIGVPLFFFELRDAVRVLSPAIRNSDISLPSPRDGALAASRPGWECVIAIWRISAQ